MAVIESEREIKAVSVIFFFLVEHNKQQTLWSRCNVTLTSVSSESGSRLKGWTVSLLSVNSAQRSAEVRPSDTVYGPPWSVVAAVPRWSPRDW